MEKRPTDKTNGLELGCRLLVTVKLHALTATNAVPHPHTILYRVFTVEVPLTNPPHCMHLV